MLPRLWRWPASMLRVSWMRKSTVLEGVLMIAISTRTDGRFLTFALARGRNDRMELGIDQVKRRFFFELRKV